MYMDDMGKSLFSHNAPLKNTQSQKVIIVLQNIVVSVRWYKVGELASKNRYQQTLK